MTGPIDLVARSLRTETTAPFRERLHEQAAFLREQLDAGRLETADFAIGLEMEVYAVGAGDDGHALATIPADFFGVDDRISKELGLHNAEINTDPVALRPGGFERQSTAAATGLERGREAIGDDRTLVTDAMWTIPPARGSDAYLSAHETRDGLTIATHMRSNPRYYAIDNEVLDLTDGAVPLDVPGVSRSFPSILFESLATSIQPHLQIPDVGAFPAYFNAAIRTLGPVLALSTNAPFMPPDLYDDGIDPWDLLEETPHELRIAVFEQSVNHSEHPKVRVPDDIATTADGIDRVVADDLYAPFLADWANGHDDETFSAQFPEFEHKRGTYWRWVRAVIGGDPVPEAGDERSIRLEYRPLPTQPTVADNISLQALTAGLLLGLVDAEHPVTELPWTDARDSFYAAAEDGLGADLQWVDADGERTTDSETIFAEVFEYARRGLAVQGFADSRIDEVLGPIEARWTQQSTPSQWKRETVRRRLADGATLESAIREMQREYVRHSQRTDSFAEWLD
ncbi:hypothetical protein [Halorhabdus sp. CUG00001]|uniref:hypothetical protein n=1 Tax=Halorhabdus sp. CUG00001 TaxID=2600297 RepID=UPI00131AB762|nr:hypothetical protein [Halorhabdus sp. CUG00001]